MSTDGWVADASNQPAPTPQEQERESCVHCGDRCATGAVIADGRHFCCLGCKAVFGLLTDSGLGQFYELAPAPGARVKEATQAGRWTFLDDPSVQSKLLDFADESWARVTLHLPAMHCVACVWLLENLFRLRAGVGESRVNFARREVAITFERALVKLSDIASLLASLGYEPELTYGKMDQGEGSKAPRWRRRRWLQIGIAGFAFGNVMLLALPGYLGLDSLSGPWFRKLSGWLGLGLALPSLLYSAADYWSTAWASLQRRTMTLDVPIALGLAAIYGQSVYEVMAGREGYADSLTGLIFFLLCGRLFQLKTFDRLTFDRDYKGFFPLAVARKTEEGQETVAISELRVGDRLVIRHGELVPADARLISGDARVDYSFVTGESEPVTRREGDLLYAGGRQAGGAIEVETIKPVSASYLASLWESEAFRKPREDERDSLTNRYSRRFTFAVIGVALSAAVFWMMVEAGVAVKAFASVLIVACPCALALAAPITLGSAQRLLATLGVFLRNASVVERMAEVDTIVLDKTGTVTTGANGCVTWLGAPLTEAERRWICSTTRPSTHPLAVRIGNGLNSESFIEPVRDFQEMTGFGIEGEVAARRIMMGSAGWLSSRGVPAPSAPSTVAQGSAVHVAIGGRHRGCFLVESPLRPELESLAARLRGAFQLVLLSGDNARELERFRALLGEGARLEFNKSPIDKLNAIRELQAAGRKVMMVGDGLNDAGALRQAEVGVAVVEKVGTFTPASDVILDAAQLQRLAEVLLFALYPPSKARKPAARAGFLYVFDFKPVATCPFSIIP